MVSNQYCQDCDNFINRRSKTKHINSKAHLYMYYNIITNKYNIGDVNWCDLVETIHEYMMINLPKFRKFSIVVECKIDNKDISILIDKIKGYVPFYKLDDDEEEWIHLKYLNRYKIRNYTLYRCGLCDTVFRSSTVISDVMITFFSNYKSMIAKHKMQQPRRYLESNLLKHIQNMSYNDKINKYNFLSREYNLKNFNQNLNESSLTMSLITFFYI